MAIDYRKRAKKVASDPFVVIDANYFIDDSGIIVYDHRPIHSTTNMSAFPSTRVIDDCKVSALAYQHWFRYCHVLKIVNRQGMKVLDIGAGDCMAGFFLYRNMRRPKYAAIDLDHSRLQKAVDRGFGLEEYIFIQRDLTKDLPFDDNSFDIVLAYEVIEHVERNQAIGIVMECHRVLAEGGLLSLSTPNRRTTKIAKKYKRFKAHGTRGKFEEHPYEWSLDDLLILLKTVGFDPKKTLTYGQDFDHIKAAGKPLDLFRQSLRNYFPSSIARVILSLTDPDNASFVMVEAIK